MASALVHAGRGGSALRTRNPCDGAGVREERLAGGQEVWFQTLSGLLGARYREDSIELDFPSLPPAQAFPPSGLLEALRLTVPPRWTGVNAHQYWLLDVGSAEAVRALKPDPGVGDAV